MAKRGGFPGGMPGNMNNLMKQAQKMQEQQQIQSLWRKCKIPVNKRGQEEWQMFYHKAR